MTNNGDTRSKRKQPTTPSRERPMKQVKTDSGDYSNGTDMSNGGDIPLDIDDGRMITRAPTTADTAEWQNTVQKVIKNVVSIHFCQTCSFDTDPAVASEATGFVVDAEKGYILTNRHVVGAGPFWGYCIFDNHEEVDVHPVYRDPVHDFGILRFDPEKIKYMPLSALKLRPDLAKVGVEIRVVGNDAGEKLSILSGVISRLDRNAPEYGEGYCDFNTNYIQAAAAASGGSSGSPVVNIDGHAVALQAGGRSDGAATDYFLPLDRPLRALQRLQRGGFVTRGTIQTHWLLKPYDECRRLGLTADWEATMRAKFPEETGMLVAETVLPQGPGDEKLEEGDLLLKINGELVAQFIRLDDILDSSVAQTIKVLVQRGGEDLEVELTVGDLHAITPDRFVNVAGGSFHDLSYQQARMYAISTKGVGVYVGEAAGSFWLEGSDSGWIVQSVDNRDTPDLDTFVEVMKTIPDRSRVVVAYKHLRDLHTLNTKIVNIDRHWSKKIRLAVRNDETGLWDYSDLADALPAVQPSPRRARFIEMKNDNYPKAVDIIRSFVKVSAHMPVKMDGFPRARKSGYGLVIDAEKGLVVISRAIVPYDFCDIHITIADSIQVVGKVLFMHPLQNFAILQYDASLVDAPVKSAKLSTKYVKQGQETIFFGFNQNYRPVSAKTTVTDITTVAIPASASTPRYRAINCDAVTVDSSLGGQCGSGVLVSKDGTVEALWLTYLGERSPHSGKDMEYHLGLMTPMIAPVIQEIQKGITPNLRILNVEMHTIHMDQARIMGVSDEWIERIEKEDPERHQIFMVRKVDSGHNDGLQESDVVLTLNNKLITRVPDLDIQYNNETLSAVIVRRRQQISITIPTVPTTDLETSRVIVFCGAVLHRPHHAVRQQISKIHSDVYISGRQRGSPAYMYNLAPTNFITHVNGVPTPDMDTFLREATKIPDNTYFRLKVMTFDNVPWVATMKKNEHYFPTMEFLKDDKDPLGWTKHIREADIRGERSLVEGTTEIEAGEEGGMVVDVPKAKL
ncbi:Pro-apoptotic serine protease NMA111 [Venturia nashicola]|uniref:Pro-apoptotic serine protease NMA111 n=1 Tax=Venturia nashicola TaxID=86259 RepID=A0A4Z1PKF2_9PEZI|nr:pro-apoptotic serine protease [Venturia nashicola]TLD35327.1 Pro-apoptotic serine protease NMA111 [Venturia nashicola]